mmetsp:Transcript_7470/g.16948  ORF Transcript_7470/g.16948 Transcript_7470/m.16948 type:complete len:152 (-) Transcript_7470:307-762(-)
MTQHNPSAAAIVADEPDADVNNDLPKRRSAATEVEVRHRGRLASLLSMLSCRSNSSISKSAHFHAQRVEDSVHVMIKHDKEVHKRQGQPEKAYAPRAPLSERLTAVHEMEAARQAALHITIEAREDDGETDMDRDILAAVAKADCVSGDGI